MSGQDYFQIYIDIIAQAFRKVRKVGFKKYNPIKDLLDVVQNFLNKQVYGRIEPSNYLLAMIVLLGSKTPKLYYPIISAIQRLFSYNFISANEDLWGSLKLLKQQHKEFLLLPIDDYSSKSFKEVYLQTLMNLNQKDEGLSLNVAKTISLIWRLDQNNIPRQLLPKIFDYILECMYSLKMDEQEKTLKSVLLEMFRHSLESYRQASDRKFLYDYNSVSVKSVVHRYGRVLADIVTIKLSIQEQHHIKDYVIVPPEGGLETFKLLPCTEVNEKGTKAGKFGWCTNCRASANYYCTTHRLPVCSFECKQVIFNDTNMLEKFLNEEERSMEVFEDHLCVMFRLFKKYLLLSDVKKRHCFADIFMLMTSELKKIVDKLSTKTYTELRGVVRQVIVNVYAQSQTFGPSLGTLRKLMHLRIFVDETEILLRLFAKKLSYFLTQPNVREDILKFIKQMINNRLLFDLALSLDCSPDRYDAVKDIIDAMRQVYIGIPHPETVNMPPAEDVTSRKLSLEACLLMLKFFQETDKKLSHASAKSIVDQKRNMNMIRTNLEKFNKSEKPIKITKKLINQGFWARDAEQIATFLHSNIKSLNLTNIGQLIGDIDEFAGHIRKHYIGQMDFRGLPLDEAMRVMLKNFMLPGESQVVERIIQTFGITYFEQNKQDTVFVHSDSVYAFSYLLMMLQSNLHNPQVVEKMTLKQFANLSKGMNGSPQAVFGQQFLESIYNSVQKKPLGVHQKLKEIEIIIAYNVSPKKALEIYLKDLQKEAIEHLDIDEQIPIQDLPHAHAYPLAVFVQEYVPQIIDMLCYKISTLDDKNQREKQEIVKCLETIEGAMKLSHEWMVSNVIQRAIIKLWEEIQKTNSNKKVLLMEAMLQWARKFSQHISEEWKIVIVLIGKFNRSKAIRKEPSSKKHSAIYLLEGKVYLNESYVEHLIHKTHKMQLENVLNFFRALLAASKQETNETGSSFCLQKINEVLQLNSSRAVEILNVFWKELRDYYIQLGQHKNQRVALFAADFLKQIVTKFIKKKQLLFLQKEYLKPFQQIFTSSKSFPVKELMIGSLSYFVNNHHVNLKSGWRVVLAVTSSCFEEEEDKVIKEKAFAILRKIYESGFTIFNLQENYNDIVQILGKLTRERQQSYGLGCLQIIQLIVDYYHQKLGLNLDEGIDSKANEVDIHFWQTIFLPLLSIIFPMCGDCRPKVQAPAIKALFSILMKYGKLFKYQFWKMVLQGVLRPAFEEITYTSQSRLLKKEQLEKWLNYSFTELFMSINELIVMYYHDFRLFLEDVFKIYENCILNHSLMLLIELSLKALNQLLEKIAPNFQEHDWQVYLFFVQSLLKKTLPIQLSSIDSWNRSKDLLENNHEAKCFALQTFLNKMQIIFQKYPESITEKIYLDVLKELDPIYQFVFEFNQNLELRQTLWKNGFYHEQKFLPGLVRHQFEILAFRSKIYYKLIQFDQSYLKSYFKLFFSILEGLKENVLKQCLKQATLKDYERERSSVHFRNLVQNILLKQIMAMGPETIKKAEMTDRLLQECLNLMNSRVYCTRCNYCQGCQKNAPAWESINSQLRQIVMMLFNAR